MRVVWASPAAPTVFTDPRNGKKYAGKYQLEVVLYEPGENSTRLHGGRGVPLASPVTSFRESAGPGGAFRPLPPDTMAVDPIVVADEVFASLPQSANVRVRWKFVPEAAL